MQQLELVDSSLNLEMDSQYLNLEIDSQDLSLEIDSQYLNLEIDSQDLSLEIDSQYLNLEIDSQDLSLELLEQGIQGPPGQGVSSSSRFSQTFTQAGLSIAGVLVLNHNRSAYPVSVLLWNASGESIVPDRIEIATLDTLAIYLDSFLPLEGSWQVTLSF